MTASPEATERRVQTICLLTLSFIAVAGALYWLRPVMIPFILAILLSYAIGPLIDLLVLKARFPRGLAIVAAILLGFLVFSLLGGLISGSVKQLAANASTYEQEIRRLVTEATAALSGMGIEIGSDQVQGALSKAPIGSTVVKLANAVVDMLSNTFLVLIFAIYLLQGRRPGKKSAGMRGEVDAKIKRYLGLKVALSAATGVLTGVILAILGVDLALVFGVLAFLLNFIPSVGSIVAILLPIPIVLISPDAGWGTLVLAVALPGAVQMTIGNVLEPKLMGESLDLHPITVLLTLILWGMLWGVVGMVLATPITAVLKILFEHHELTRPVARLMAGRLNEDDAAEAEAG